jgi:predicted RNA-binding protein
LTIIPEDERSSLPLDTDEIIYHPDMIRANEWILTEYKAPVREFCIFVPCAKKKPYHESPSHKIFDKVIFEMLKPEQVHVVVFGTCGITPRELDTEYPFMDYQFMLGKCNVAKIKRDFIKMESQRLAEYLEKTRDNYRYRIAYCIGDFRKAMELAVEMSGVEVTIVPEEETINSHVQPGKKFIYGSLNQASYLQDFSDAIASYVGKELFRAVSETKISEEEEENTNVNDNDWYII